MTVGTGPSTALRFAQDDKKEKRFAQDDKKEKRCAQDDKVVRGQAVL